MQQFILRILYVVAIIQLPVFTQAQYFRGEVTDLKEQPIEGATVVWVGTSIGARTGENGAFAIPLPDTTVHPRRIAAVFQGVRDTFDIDDYGAFWTLVMQANLELKEVRVQGQRNGSFVSVLQPIKTEIINRDELRKAACCDLAGCFETQATVQPQTTNVLTNAKELRILGLSGVYNQVLVDGAPLIQGLTYTYGISTIPGSVVEQIWVTKGANSVLQGFESISGQINVLTRDGTGAEPFYLNGYINSFGERHLNASVATGRKKWSNYTALHTVQPARRVDRDGDAFMDLPLLRRYMVLNKWRYGSDNQAGWHAMVGMRYTHEQRVGGQTDFRPDSDAGTTRVYGQLVQINQPELYTRSGYRFDARRAITFIGSAFMQHQDSYFGVTRYGAQQRNAYANLQYEYDWGPEQRHSLKTGLSYRHLDLKEDIAFTSDTLPRTFDGQYMRREQIPGLFAEQTMRLWNRVTWIMGVRTDWHNQFGGRLTPRTLVRYTPNPNTDLRASVGTGWRTVNLFSENINLLTGGRDLVFEDALQPERALNTGFNVLQRWNIPGLAITASADVYHTRFQNQFFPDYDSQPGKAVIANFTGPSRSNNIQIDLGLKLFQQWEMKFAYNYLEVYRQTASGRVDLPFNPKDKLLGVFSYRPSHQKWQADVNIHWYGRQRLPDTRTYPEDFRQPAFSERYTIASAQYTRTIGQLELYAGCENILDFRQLRPIVSWQNPFSPYFDTAFVWGPTRGREFYLGFRYKINPKQPG